LCCVILFLDMLQNREMVLRVFRRAVLCAANWRQ